MKKQKPALVALTWKDAHGTATEAYSLHELPHAPILITTYGLLLREDESGISIACEECADGTYRGVTFVPQTLIASVKVIRGHKKREAAKLDESTENRN